MVLEREGEKVREKGEDEDKERQRCLRQANREEEKEQGEIEKAEANEIRRCLLSSYNKS